MAVTTGPAEKLAESVKQEVSESALCTNATLGALRQLLGHSVASKKRACANGSFLEESRPLESKTIRAPVRRKAATKAKFTIHEEKRTQHETLSISVQLSFATEIFNTALKTLSEAIKIQVTNISHDRRSVSRAPLSGQPLQVASPNYKRPSEPQNKAKILSLASSSDSTHSLDNVAQCAQTALNALRSLPRSTKPNDASTNIQLAQATSALVSRLISLNMPLIAWEELGCLRQHLVAVVTEDNGRQVSQADKSPSKSTTPGVKLMLELPAVSKNGVLLKMVLNFHMYAMRCVALQPANVNIRELVNAFNHSQSNNPANIVTSSFEQGLISPGDANQHLTALSHTLLIICRAYSASGLPNDVTKAKEVFDLQSTALRIRCCSWSVLSSQVNLQTELWTPLTKYLSNFYTSCKPCRKDHALACLNTVEGLESVLRTRNGQMEVSDKPLAVMILLARMAEEARLSEEALVLYESLSTRQDARTGMTSVIVTCRIATLRLQNTKECSSDLTEESLALARTAFTGSMKGTAAELEELYKVVLNLHKAVKKFIIQINAPTISVANWQRRNLSSCARTIYDLILFLLRYVGNPGSSEGEISASSRYEVRSENMKESGRSILETFLQLGRNSLEPDGPPWEDFEHATQNALTLYEKHQSQEVLSSTNSQSFVVKLSNLYWARYLKLKTTEARLEEVIVPLNRSAKLLTNCSVSERESGKITEKLERLASTSITLCQINAALEAYSTAIRTSAESGRLDAVAKEATHQAYQALWSSSQNQSLHRVLSGFARLTMRSKSPTMQTILNQNLFSKAAKCLLLEQQIYTFTSLKVADINVRGFVEVLSDLMKSLDQDLYPIRRLRVLHHVLFFASREINVLPEDLLLGLVAEVNDLCPAKTLGHDEGLARFHTHLLTSTQLLSAFTRSRPSFDHCHHAVQSWKAMLQSIESQNDLQDQIEDPQAFYRQLEALSDFADMHDYGDLREDTLQIMVRYLELQPQIDDSALSSCLSQLALQLSRKGYSKRAGHIFARAKRHLERAKSKTLISLQWNLAYAEYLIDIANLERSSEILMSAQWLFDTDFPGELDTQDVRHSRLARDKYLAYAAYITSRLCVEQQDPYMALKSAKQCVRLTSRIWAGLERLTGTKHVNKQQKKSDPDNSDLETDHIAQEIGGHSLSETSRKSMNRPALGAAFWPYVSIHYHGLMQMSVISAHNEMFQDSIYYCEQARHIANGVGAVQQVAAAEASLTNYLAKGGLWKESWQMYQACQNSLQRRGSSLYALRIESLLAQVSLARTLASTAGGDHEEFEKSRHILAATLTSTVQLQTSYSSSGAVRDLEESMSKLELRENPTGNTKKPKTQFSGKSSRSVSRKPALPVSSKECEPSHSDMTDLLPIVRCEQELKILNARFLIKDGNVRDAASVLQELPLSLVSVDDRLFASMLLVGTFVARAEAAIAGDAVYCVLPESSVAYPSVIGKKGQAIDAPTNAEKLRSVTTKSKRAPQKAPLCNNFSITMDLLTSTRSRLVEIRRSLTCIVKSCVFHNFCSLWNEAAMLSSAIGLHLDNGPLSLMSVSCLDRAHPFARERMAIDLDKSFEERVWAHDWPSDRIQENSHDIEQFDETSLAETIVRTLPDHWDVVSIQMINEGAEFLISKVRRDRTPFFLRLPLRRSSSDGSDDPDEFFDFKTCRNEMLSIVDCANKTAHDGRSSEGREAKKEWWVEREALDEQLKSLLENIENYWLGGFKGIFSPHTRKTDLLARFSQSFEQVLDKNLPSRGRPNSIEHECPGLHSDVLDLFIGLGDPSKNELDDSVTDLLYFVVDILQFHGERNAYDEIDFDMMAIQTIDALRAYHEACKLPEDSDAKHTILILDKSLHVFPWESLPCLRGWSVSRLPSLLCLRNRISMIPAQHNPSAGLRIDRTSGSFILNPSSDLKGTEDTFASRFASSLPGFTSIVDRPPTEPEFKSCLSDTPLCLYFGHGSGAQFIRGRTIRRLDKCAVTFLMGCSSSKLVECGEYEPYGVPWNYMHAGAPALVGTLWDVTDKDIDRFAMKTLENWGLLGPENSAKEETKTPRRPGRSKARTANQAKGGKKAAENEGQRGAMSLDEAVANGRDACVLKYLNGAAPVIYGIPVSLIDA